MILDGGELVERPVYEHRKNICDGCEKKGAVNVLGLAFEGCTVCGCPFDTKLWMEKVVNKIHQTVLGTEKVFCPHPDGDKWEGKEMS